MQVYWISININKPDQNKGHIVLYASTRIEIHQGELNEPCDCHTYDIVTHWSYLDRIHLPFEIRQQMMRKEKKSKLNGLTKQDYNKPYKVLNVKNKV